MSTLPIPKVQIDVNADHSCNWRCCWGCKCLERAKSPVSETDVVIEETARKVTHIRKIHLDTPQTVDTK